MDTFKIYCLIAYTFASGVLKPPYHPLRLAIDLESLQRTDCNVEMQQKCARAARAVRASSTGPLSVNYLLTGPRLDRCLRRGRRNANKEFLIFISELLI